MPGGWMVMLRTCGLRFRCRYAALTEVTTGVLFWPDSTARHCKYLAFGLVIAEPSGFVYAVDHALHVSSGVSVLPDLVNSSTRVPAGVVPCHVSAPHVETIWASRLSDSYVPRLARSVA